MAAADFDYRFEGAHKYADPLSDLSVSRFTSMDPLEIWAIPAADIVNIYKKRGFFNVSENQLSQCVFLGLQITRANKALGKYLFPALAPQTPFFTNELFHYHKGGILSMAVDVAECWKSAVNWFMIGNMSSKCKHMATAYSSFTSSRRRHDTLKDARWKEDFSADSHFKKCVLMENGNILRSLLDMTGLFPHYFCSFSSLLSHSFYNLQSLLSNTNIPLDLDLESSSFIMTKAVNRSRATRFLAKVRSLIILVSSSASSIWYAANELVSPTCTSLSNTPSIILHLDKEADLFGSSVAVLVDPFHLQGSLVAISAPGHSRSDLFMNGAVYIVRWQNITDRLSFTSTIDQSHSRPFKISELKPHVLSLFPPPPPPSAGSAAAVAQNKCEMGQAGARFGNSMAVLDFNLDGIDDLVVSAPFHGSTDDRPDGCVYIYYGLGKSRSGGPFRSDGKADVIISGAVFGNREGESPWNDARALSLGEKVVAEDVDGDGNPDLLILSPHSTPFFGAHQVGQVYIFLARARPRWRPVDLNANDADFLMTGSSLYGLFGSDVFVFNADSKTLIAVGAPGTADTPGLHTPGALYIYMIDFKKKNGAVLSFLDRIDGQVHQGRFGSSISGPFQVAQSWHGTKFSILVCSSSETSNSSIPRLANLPGIFVAPSQGGYQAGICRGIDFQLNYSTSQPPPSPYFSGYTLAGSSSFAWLGNSLVSLSRQSDLFFISEPTVDAERGRVYMIRYPAESFATTQPIQDSTSFEKCFRGQERHDRFGSSLSYSDPIQALFVGSMRTKSEKSFSGELRVVLPMLPL